MGTVAPTSAGIADLLQTLSNFGSPLVSSTQGSTALQSALQNAPPEDTVKLSEAALQLQEVEEIFGTSNPSGGDNLFAAIDSSLTGSTATGTSATASSSTAGASGTGSTADQLAALQSDSQANQVATLLGNNADPASPGSLLNVLA